MRPAVDVAIEGWPALAACKGRATSIFFPMGSGCKSELWRRKDDPYAVARTICAECPVKAECLKYALAVVASGQQLDGCWAGTDERERRSLAGRKVGSPPGRRIGTAS